MSNLDGPASNHRQVAAAFAARVDGVRDRAQWDAPAPVAGWRARDVVGHLVEWFPAFLVAGSDVRLPAGAAIEVDPAGAWRTQCDAVQRLLDDPATEHLRLVNPHIGELALAEAIDRFYTADVFMHTWDLARATGQDDTLDSTYCTQLLEGMIPMEKILRASGQFGSRVDVPDDAPVQQRLVGFIGRDPYWQPPARG